MMTRFFLFILCLALLAFFTYFNFYIDIKLWEWAHTSQRNAQRAPHQTEFYFSSSVCLFYSRFLASHPIAVLILLDCFFLRLLFYAVITLRNGIRCGCHKIIKIKTKYGMQDACSVANSFHTFLCGREGNIINA